MAKSTDYYRQKRGELSDMDVDDIINRGMRKLDKAMEGMDKSMEGMDSKFDRARKQFEKKISDTNTKFKRKVFVNTDDHIGFPKMLKILGLIIKSGLILAVLLFIITMAISFIDYKKDKALEPKPLNPIEQTQPKDDSFKKL